MKKSITVIIKKKNLNQDPTKAIKKVALGYAFNYLIPNQLAEIATQGKIKHLKTIQYTLSKEKKLIHNNNLKIKQDLEKITICHIRKTCSQNKQIFGSISEQDIVQKIFQVTGQKIEKKLITIKSIKQTGTYNCKISLDNNLIVNIKLYILPNIV